MSSKNKYFVIIISAVAIVSLGGWLSKIIGSAERDYYRSVKENIILFGQIYSEISDRYVEEIDPEKFMRAGIDGMLSKLDPYTVFIEREAGEELRIMTMGRYYGVGMPIVMRNGWPTVSDQPFEGTPALRAGIREGDQIIAVDGKSTEDLSLGETASRLRGKRKGTEVVVTIRRVGESEPLIFHLIRDEIKIEDVSYSGFVKPGIGLIKLARFSRNSGREVYDAIQELHDQGLNALIFDLRGNPGGLLDAAVAVADNFIPKGQVIVSTKGRDGKHGQVLVAKNEPIAADIPLVVLIDRYSASASEIVSGAVQDLDRGVTVGSNTFGKGLVQEVISIDRRGEKQLKITTRKYYTPSGRLIQRPEVFEKGARSVFINTDSTKEDEFTTLGGREVHGGGGITPDVEVKNPALNRFEIELVRKSMFFNFALQYAADHPDLDGKVNVDETLVQEFLSFVKEKGLDYKIEGEEELEKLKEVADKEDFDDEISVELTSINDKLKEMKAKQMSESSENLNFLLRREIAGKIGGKRAFYEVSFKGDRVLQKAIEILENPSEYAHILHPNAEEG